LTHARPRHARPVQPPGSQGCDSRRCGGAHRSLQEITRLDSRFTHVVLARRRWAREDEWPKSTTRSWGGSLVARRPAIRQDHAAAHPNAVGSTQSRDQGGEEVKRAATVLTLGRRCSRGLLREGGQRGVVQHGVSVPALFPLLCVSERLPRTAPRWSLSAPVLARRRRRNIRCALLLLTTRLHSPLLPPSCGGETGEGKTPSG
jgi:hypothetical protein